MVDLSKLLNSITFGGDIRDAEGRGGKTERLKAFLQAHQLEKSLPSVVHKATQDESLVTLITKPCTHSPIGKRR